MKTIAIMQPGYLPWIGLFELMHRSDIFFIYDTVKFTKNDWRNRNRIKTANGPLWLTVPANSSGEPLLSDILIDNTTAWRKKHLKSIELNYGKSEYFNKYFPGVEKILSKEWYKLNELNLAFIKFLADSFNIKYKLKLASEMPERRDLDTLKKVERLIKICKISKADIFYEAAGGKGYLENEIKNFEAEGIKLIFQNMEIIPYRQLHGEFIPCLSALDLLMNEGENGREIIIKSGSKFKN